MKGTARPAFVWSPATPPHVEARELRESYQGGEGPFRRWWRQAMSAESNPIADQLASLEAMPKRTEKQAVYGPSPLAGTYQTLRLLEMIEQAHLRRMAVHRPQTRKEEQQPVPLEALREVARW